MNRRDFIKNSAGAFFIASAGRALGVGAASNRVRLAIVGCHAKGRGFAVMRAAMKIPGVDISAVCDVDSRAMESAGDEVRRLTDVSVIKEKDLRKLVEKKDIDGVLIETPDHWHAYGAILGLKAGKAVYVEKPCCFCPAEGLILLRTAQETGKTLQIGSQRRSSFTYKATLDWLKSTGAIGEMRWGKAWYMANRASIGHGKVAAVPEWLDWELWQGPAPRREFRDNVVHYNWHWFRNWGTAEMGNNAPHFVDVARWFLEENEFPVETQCAGGQLFPKDDDYEFPDTYNASFNYRSGKCITLELTSHCKGNPYMKAATGAMVYGTKGSVFLGPNDTAKVFDEKSRVIKEWFPDGRKKEDDKPLSKTNPTAALDVLHLQNFVDCIRANSQATMASADVGVKSSMLPILANLAIDCKETIRVDPVSGKLVGKAGLNGWAREYAKGWELV